MHGSTHSWRRKVNDELQSPAALLLVRKKEKKFLENYVQKFGDTKD
jgi:hypothetical protein